MKPIGLRLTPRGIPASRALPAQLFYTIFVFCATGLMMVIAIFAFIFAFLLRLIDPAPTSRPSRAGRRHVTFLLEPKIMITPSTSSTPQQSPSLSLTTTPRELEPPTPDVAEDPLRALTRICGFLTCNISRARKRDQLAITPPLAGLGLYLDAVRVDLARIDELVQERRQEPEEEHRSDEGSDRKETEDEVPRVGLDAGADVNAHDEPGLVVNPHQTTHADPLLSPPSQFPTTHSPISPLDPSSSSSTSTSTAHPPRPTVITTTTKTTTTSTTTPNPRKRKDAVLRVPNNNKVSDPYHADADADADADDAAVRAAALLARFADLGAGTVRERGAALWTALSGRSTPPEPPVMPPLPPNTRTSVALVATPPRDVPVSVVETSRVVAHQAAWRARFATYGRMLGQATEQRGFFLLA
ncbi:hypothetical protein BGW80DRAFT_510758 [Lactifluus volemus]|nr:hypothetical protein BGW80DRAFT_510758 [Lactifluus volemus]